MDFYTLDKTHNKSAKQQNPNSIDHLNVNLDYQSLAQSILKKLEIKSSKTSQVLFALQNQGLNLDDLYITLFWPRAVKAPQEYLNRTAATSLHVKRRWVQPILKELRGDFSFAEIAQLFQIKSIATYHHWESGRREIPFSFFLMAIDKFQGRLQAFIDSLPFEINIDITSLNLKPKLYQHFFANPWTPTVMLAFRLPTILEMKSISQQIAFLTENLSLTLPQIEESIRQLLHLQLVKIENGRLRSEPKQLYAIPAISEEKINELRNYWFITEAEFLLKRPGLHRFEQHATTHESKEKIMGWIAELREKIRNEVKQSGSPETLIHITWQVAEVL